MLLSNDPSGKGANAGVNIIDLDAYMSVGDVCGFDASSENAVGVGGQEAWDQIWHYERNYFNGKAPTLAEIQNMGLEPVSERAARYHCAPDSDCVKYVIPETGQEFVYVDGEITNNAAILGTYNYATDPTFFVEYSPPGVDSFSEGHYNLDMKPYFDWGNSPNDPGFLITTNPTNTQNGIKQGVAFPVENFGVPAEDVDALALPTNPSGR